MMELTTDIENRIERVILGKFHNHITPYDVIRWLGNFEDSDISCALDLFEHVVYLRENDLKRVILQYLGTLVGKNKHIIPLGNAGKSGGTALYWVHGLIPRKTAFYSDLGRFLQYLRTGAWNPQTDILVLVDDYIGSGESVVTALSDDKVLKAEIRELAQKGCLYVFSAVVSDMGKENIEKEIPGSVVLGDVYPKGFDPHKKIFGSYFKTKAVREMCYKYGKDLYKKHPLGFMNCQGLVLMQHSSPNNAVPVLWSDNTYKGRKWQPLIPRSNTLKASRSYEDRTSINRWIMLLKNFFDENIELYRLFTKTNYNLTYIFICLMKRQTEAAIFNTLAITHAEMENLWTAGISLKLWDSQHNPTSKAIELYQEAVRMYGILNKEDDAQSYVIKDEREHMYIPETFRGVK